MIAIVSGSPSVAARTTDCGVPPTAIHTGSGSCSARGYTPASTSGARCGPDQVTRSARPHRQQQLELGGEQLVVVLEVLPEQRERLGERPAARHDLGAPARQQVERREVLVHAHGIVATTARSRRSTAARATSAPPAPPARPPGRRPRSPPGDAPRPRRRRARPTRRAPPARRAPAAAAARPPRPRRDPCRRRWRSRVPWPPSVPRSAYFE